MLVVRSVWLFCSRCPAMRFTYNGRLSFARVYARRSSTGRTACVGTRAMPFGLARVVQDEGSATDVAERPDNSLIAADSPRLESDVVMSLGFRAVRIGLPCSSGCWRCSQTLSSREKHNVNSRSSQHCRTTHLPKL